MSIFKLKAGFIREKFTFGLDIGTQSIKYAKLKFHTKDSVELCGFNLMPAGNDLEGTLRSIRQSEGVDSVNISVSGPQTVIRHVNFPRMNENELRQALKFEAQKHIPFPVEEVNLDSYILKEDLPDNKMLVLIAAVKKELIHQRLKLIDTAGFRVNIIDIDSLALSNAFNFNYLQEENAKYKAVALLNIGSSMSNLDILENGMPRLSRDIHIAGNNFTQKLMEVFNLDFNAAEELKINPVRNTAEATQESKISNGVNPDTERVKSVSAAIESVFANLASSIRTSFDYYESQSTTTVSKIFLSGGSTKFTGLKDMLANLLGIEVECWDPLKKIKLLESIDPQKINACLSQLAVAVGLALRQ